VNDFTSTAESNPTTVKHIAESTVRRLSLYLRFLEEHDARGNATISSGDLARFGGTTSAQVRKDLSFFGSFGKRGMGYAVKDLIAAIRDILGLGRTWSVVIIGAGKIGAALAQYRGFTSRGFKVAGIYDSDPAKVGTPLDGVTVKADSELERDIKRLDPDIAVLCVPPEAAQPLVDRVARAGMRAILNFAPSPLQAPEGVTIRAVNMATELEILAFGITQQAK
jgi:redox-sensing transcriptional repressor